ncbi:MAG: nuclear transport factor 2 family protein [Mycobacterium sp.]|nr:nuclear transport factor 2 family protein [Mycobacterium sp.]
MREVVTEHLRLVETGTADQITALYADDATLEDPVGSEVRRGAAAIREFYATVEPLETETRLVELRVVAGTAAFHFVIVTRPEGMTVTVSPIEVMTFDDEGRITSMKAYWGDADMRFG